MTETTTAPEDVAQVEHNEGDEEKRTVVRTQGVKKSYKMGDIEVHALRGVDLEIYSGEYLSIMGPSGSGKSTFFNMIGALDRPTTGRVFIDEVDVAQLTAEELAYVRCHKIGYIFQSYNLVQYMTALENVTTPMVFGGVGPDESRRRGMELLELVGLGDRWHHRPLEMSGGQQQRVAIARSLANQPTVLLCDEPTANLDLHTGQEILDVLRSLNEKKGVTVICATHDHRMMDMCDRLMWIRDGAIERVARRDEVHVEVGSIGEE